MPQEEINTTMLTKEQQSEINQNFIESKPVKLSEADKIILDSLKYKRDLSMCMAERELARSESAELSYKYVVLQLYMKYHLTEQDAINENGDILYGGAKRKQSISV